MKILCTADWHIGKKLEAFSRLDEQRDILNQISTISQSHMVDVVIVAGDCFDTQHPSPEMTKLFVKTLADLSRNGECLVLVIAGNHDSPLFLSTSEAFASQLGVVIVGYPDDIPHLEDQDSPWSILSQDKGMIEILFKKKKKKIRFLLTPYANAQRLKKDLGTEDTDKKAWDILCDQWRKNISHEDDVTNILVTHYFMQSESSGDLYQDSPLEEDDTERSMLGTIGAMSMTTVPEGIDYMILGHIHRPYSLYSSKGIHAMYTGSPLPYSIKETSYQKSILLLDVSKKKSTERIQLSVKRTIKEIIFNDFEDIFERLDIEKENYVTLIWTGDRYFTAEEHLKLRESHPRILRIESCVKIEENPLNHDLDLVKNQDPRMLFEEYFGSKNKGQQPPEDLLEVFDEVLSEEHSHHPLLRKQGFLPKKLLIKGFYSYKNLVEIDFSEFNGKNFFGIFGAVGSGKSAIIEAMIFVLFGRVKRFGSIRASSGNFSVTYGMMNLESTEMLIEFVFEIMGQDGLEEYLCRISGKRDKKDFTKILPIKREFFINKHEEWISFDYDLNTVGEEILGISYDDFCKTIILQQRDFDGFLSSKPTETADTLMRLFQLERFDLSLRVDLVSKGLAAEVDSLKNKIEELVLISEEYVAELESEHTQLQEELNDDNILLQQKRTYLYQLEQKYQQKRHFEEIKKHRQELLEQKDEFDKSKQRNHIQPIIDAVTKLKELNQQQSLLFSKKEDLEKLINQYVVQEQIETTKSEDLFQKIASVQKNIHDIEQEREALLSDALNDDHHKLMSFDGCIKFVEDREARLVIVSKKMEEHKQKSENIQELTKKLSLLQDQENEIRKNKGAQALLMYLKDNAPCPLCGSLEHPNPCQSDDGVNLEEILQHMSVIQKSLQESTTAVSQYQECLADK
ncbi:MAG: exonuclease subunit SbcD, partial [Brevinema sp.]